VRGERIEKRTRRGEEKGKRMRMRMRMRRESVCERM